MHGRSFAGLQLTNVDEMRHNVEALERVSAALDDARLECDAINREEQLFDWSLTQFPQLDAMMHAKDPYEKLWNTAYHFAVVSEQWLHGRCLCRLQYEICKAPCCRGFGGAVERDS